LCHSPLLIWHFKGNYHPRFGAHQIAEDQCQAGLQEVRKKSSHILGQKKSSHISPFTHFCSICDSLKLQIRGIHGEHSETEGGVYDISNKARLGLTEFEGLYLNERCF
jgi:hypothetical protein